MIKPVSVDNTLMKLIEINTADSEEPMLELNIGSTSCTISIKDIKRIKQMLSDGESLLTKRKEQIALNNNLKLF